MVITALIVADVPIETAVPLIVIVLAVNCALVMPPFVIETAPLFTVKFAELKDATPNTEVVAVATLTVID